jgi:hypothetical protein
MRTISVRRAVNAEHHLSREQRAAAGMRGRRQGAVSRRRRPALVRGLLVLALAAVGAVAVSSPGQAHPDPAQRRAVDRTSLTLVIRGCDRCTVQLQHAVEGEADHVWTSHARRVGSDHEIVFHPRTGRTHGLSIVLHAPWAGSTGAVPNFVTRYAGHRVGTAVDRSDARHARRATGCWAGTRADSARLAFRVDRVRVRTLDGHRAKAPLVYSGRTLPSWKPYVRTHKGTIGNQDAFYCTRP